LLLHAFALPDREFIRGDLDEEYARVACEDERRARAWYRSQAVRGVVTGLRMRVRGRDGNVTYERRARAMSGWLPDLRYALRAVRKAPWASALIVATLGVGTGATIAIFTVANEVLFESLTFADADELVMVWEDNRERSWSQIHQSPANVMDFRERVRSFEDIALFSDFTDSRALTLDGGAEQVDVGIVGGNLFTVLGVQPQLGRVFTMEETWASSEPVVMLSHRAWQRWFAGDPGVLGRTLDLGRVPHTVVGVMPSWFDYAFTASDMWVTFRFSEARANSVWFRQAHIARAVARLRDGVTIEQARAELAAVGQQLQQEYPELNRAMEPGLGPLHGFLVREERTPIVLLLGAVSVLLLIAISNVANLQLVRSAVRAREVAVRSSLGASRGRVIRQLLLESGVLAAAGTLLGLGLAAATLAIVRSIGAQGLPPLSLDLDVRLVAFVLALALVSALLFGLAPALRGSRVSLRNVLGDAGRSGTAGRGTLRTSNAIVMVEVALAVLLATAAGLTFRTLAGLNGIDDGVDASNVLTFRMTPPAGAYDDTQRALLGLRVSERLSSVPGVVDVGVTRRVALLGYAWSSDFTIEGWSADEFGADVKHREALPGYFTTMGIPVLDGRLFDARPRMDQGLPVVVNRAFVERYFPDSSPVGRRVCFNRQATDSCYWYPIVAVVDNERMSFRDEPVPEIIAHLAGDVPGTLTFVVKAAAAPLSLVPAIRSAIAELDAGIPLFEVQTMDAIRRFALARERFVFVVFGVLAGCALLLACVGVYGVATWAARARDREVGIRVALGATRLSILTQFARTGVRSVALGLGLGLIGTVAAARLMESLLWGVAPRDPTTLSFVAIVLLLCGFTASWIPAFRASRKDPASVMRDG
jgi:putative ABC transport system permease protein